MRAEPEKLWEDLPELGVREVREDLPITKEFIYLDSAATCLTPRPVWEAMADYYLNLNANVERGAYRLANQATEVMHRAHELTARLLLKCAPGELIFTRNLTQAANMAAYHLSGQDLKGKKVITSDVEHHSNFLPWLRLCRRTGAELVILETGDGILDPADLERNIDKSTALAALQHCSNVTGAVQDVKELAGICRERGVPCFIDGSQGPGHMEVDVKKMGCDLYGFSGHKGPMGPTGTGGLYVRKDLLEEALGGYDEALAREGRLALSEDGTYAKVLFEPMEVGGGMIVDVDYDRYVLRGPPARYGAGTPDIAGQIGLGRAAVYVAKQIGLKKIEKREKLLTKQLFEGLSGIRGVTVYGPEDLSRRSGLVTFNVEGRGSKEVSRVLDERYNICTRAGGHCVAPWHKKHDLLAGSVRASVHYYTIEEEIKKLLEAVKELS